MSSRTYRVGVVGFAYGHIFSIIKSFAELCNVQFVACADTMPSHPSQTRRTPLAYERTQATIGASIRTYEDWREMLDTESLDIVLFCPEKARYGEIAEAIAASGAHMVTEKPIAATLSDALRVMRAAEYHDVKLAVNWPTTWSPAVRKAKELIDQGVIGDLLEFKWRNGGSLGPAWPVANYGDEVNPQDKNICWWWRSAEGGGVMLDYCCYGAILSRWYIGEPATAAMGIKANLNSPYGDAEDNAIISVRYPKALALLEASWTTRNIAVPNGPIVYGTDGTLVVHNKGDVHVHTQRSYGLTEPDQIIAGDPLIEGRETLAKEFIHHIETGESLHPTLDPLMNLDAMAILDAGQRSAASGKMELVNDSNWCIG
jgi:predicted dehydrogenase